MKFFFTKTLLKNFLKTSVLTLCGYCLYDLGKMSLIDEIPEISYSDIGYYGQFYSLLKYIYKDIFLYILLQLQAICLKVSFDIIFLYYFLYYALIFIILLFLFYIFSIILFYIKKCYRKVFQSTKLNEKDILSIVQHVDLGVVKIMRIKDKNKKDDILEIYHLIALNNNYLESIKAKTNIKHNKINYDQEKYKLILLYKNLIENNDLTYVQQSKDLKIVANKINRLGKKYYKTFYSKKKNNFIHYKKYTRKIDNAKKRSNLVIKSMFVNNIKKKKQDNIKYLCPRQK